MELYHGSLNNIENSIIKAHKAFDRADYKDWVHCTDNYGLGVMYSINPIRSYMQNKNITEFAHACSMHFDHAAQIPTILELYPNMLDELFNKTSYVYIVSVNERDVEKFGEHDYVINHDISYKEKIVINSVYDELKKLENANQVKIVKYDEFMRKYGDLYLEMHVATRAESCETQYEANFFLEKFADIYDVINSIPQEYRP